LTISHFNDNLSKKGDVNLKDRIRKLRKNLDLTQQEFADRLGTKRNTIANYEIGRNEPSNSVFTLICREFNVNEEWLRTGEGEMFNVLLEEDEYFAAATEISNDNDTFAMNAIIEYWKLDRASKDAIRNYLTKLVYKGKEDEQV